MAAKDDAAVEVQEHVLADRIDALEHASIDCSRDARREAARIRALRLEPLADENLEASGDAVERVTLGHA
jgi:hypothetical protein